MTSSREHILVRSNRALNSIQHVITTELTFEETMEIFCQWIRFTMNAVSWTSSIEREKKSKLRRKPNQRPDMLELNEAQSMRRTLHAHLIPAWSRDVGLSKALLQRISSSERKFDFGKASPIGCVFFKSDFVGVFLRLLLFSLSALI